MVGRAAYTAGIEMSDATVMDELGRDDTTRQRYGAPS
jgi:hypothetical protein